jgi:hypothetical protein
LPGSWHTPWRVTGRVRDVKGMHDLAALLAQPGVELAAIDLAGASSGQRQAEVIGQTLDRAALAAYRRRLVELADDLADAELNDDIGRAGRAPDEREWILAELRRSTRPGGAPPGLLVSRQLSALARPSPPASATQSTASPRSCQT